MGAVNTTYTFTATDTITSAKMNNIIDQTTMTTDAIFGTTLEVVLPSGQLKVRTQGITSSEMAADSVLAISIKDANVTPAKLSDSDFGAFTVASGVATLDADVVTTAKILNANVTAAKLDGAQTGTAPIYGARAWVRFNGNKNTSGTTDASNTNRQILGSGNVASVLKNGAGDYTVTFSTELPSANYSAVGQRAYEPTDSANVTIQAIFSIPQTASSFRFYTYADSQLANSSDVQLVFFG
jgi:hypothetical protein